MSGRLQYLLDTDILSETRKKQANQRVMSFLSSTESSALFISVLSIGEFRKGVALKAQSDANAAKRLGTWVDGLEFSFGDRVLGVDAPIAAGHSEHQRRARSRREAARSVVVMRRPLDPNPGNVQGADSLERGGRLATPAAHSFSV